MLDVSIENISIKQGNGFKSILKNISFVLPPNSIFTIAGKNGSGKSTLIKSLTALLDKRFYTIDGKILFNSQNILSYNDEELLKLRREHIKYVFQDAINSFDHLKKLGYFFNKLIKADLDEAENLLSFFLLPKSDILFKLYPYEISGGMAQRVSLVLVLLTHPEIIIVDEPTSGVDFPIANLILLKLKEFISKRNNSVLLVTQDLSFAKKVSDKISFLNDSALTEFISVLDFFNTTGNEELSLFLNSHMEILNE